MTSKSQSKRKAAARSTLAGGSPSDKERARQRAKYHANKYRDRDLAKGFDFFWSKRGGCPA